MHGAHAHHRHLGQGRHAAELHDAGLVAERLGHLPAAGQKRRGNQVQLGIEYVAAGVGQIVADPAGERYAGERLLGQGGEVVENAAGGIAIADVDEAVFRQPLADIHAGRLGHARIDRAAVDGRRNDERVLQAKRAHQVALQLHAAFAVLAQPELNDARLPGLLQQLDDPHPGDAHQFRHVLLGHFLKIIVPGSLYHQRLFVIHGAPPRRVSCLANVFRGNKCCPCT